MRSTLKSHNFWLGWATVVWLTPLWKAKTRLWNQNDLKVYSRTTQFLAILAFAKCSVLAALPVIAVPGIFYCWQMPRTRCVPCAHFVPRTWVFLRASGVNINRLLILVIHPASLPATCFSFLASKKFFTAFGECWGSAAPGPTGWTEWSHTLGTLKVDQTKFCNHEFDTRLYCTTNTERDTIHLLFKHADVISHALLQVTLKPFGRHRQGQPPT